MKASIHSASVKQNLGFRSTDGRLPTCTHPFPSFPWYCRRWCGSCSHIWADGRPRKGCTGVCRTQRQWWISGWEGPPGQLAWDCEPPAEVRRDLLVPALEVKPLVVLYFESKACFQKILSANGSEGKMLAERLFALYSKQFKVLKIKSRKKAMVIISSTSAPWLPKLDSFVKVARAELGDMPRLATYGGSDCYLCKVKCPPHGIQSVCNLTLEEEGVFIISLKARRRMGEHWEEHLLLQYVSCRQGLTDKASRGNCVLGSQLAAPGYSLFALGLLHEHLSDKAMDWCW